MKNWIGIILVVVVAAFFSYEALFAQSDTPSGVVSQKLDQVLQNQQQILQELREIKAELAVVKVRATNS